MFHDKQNQTIFLFLFFSLHPHKNIGYNFYGFQFFFSVFPSLHYSNLPVNILFIPLQLPNPHGYVYPSRLFILNLIRPGFFFCEHCYHLNIRFSVR